MSFERIDEDDGSIKLDPLACLVFQMFSIFIYFSSSRDCYNEGEFILWNSFFNFIS